MEFVAGIARISEARDVVPGGATGRTYTLYLEPQDRILGECIESVGFGGDAVEHDRFAQLRGFIPTSWRTNLDGSMSATTVPEERMRFIRLRFECAAGGRPVLTEQRRKNVDDIPELNADPSANEIFSMWWQLFGQ